MRVRDTIAAALAVGLLLQSAALAQAPHESAVVASGQKLQIGIADVISIRRPLSCEKSGNGTAFAIRAAVGTALLAVVLVVGAVASR